LGNHFIGINYSVKRINRKVKLLKIGVFELIYDLRNSSRDDS